MRTPRIPLALIVGALLARSEAALGAPIYETIARTGQQAPGTAVNTLYSNFSTPALNNVGQVIFSTQVSGGGSNINNNNVHYAGAPGSLSIVARSGNQAPGLPAGVNYSFFHKYNTNPSLKDESVINDAGQVLFLAQLTGTGVNTTNDVAVFSGTMAAPQLVAREGSQAPGTPDGVLYGVPNLRLNDAGQVSLYTFLTGSGVTTANPTNHIATFIGTPGAMQLAARDNDPAPGTPDNYGGNASSMGIPTFNDAGQIAFADSLNGPDVVLSENRYGIFAGGVGAIQLIARSGNPAAGAPAGVKYAQSSIGFAPNINDSGQLAYAASWTTGIGGVDSTNDAVLYAGPIGSPQLIAREGDPAPGTPPGTVYATVGAGVFPPPMINDAGGIYFEAALSGAGVTAANDRARYAGPWAAPRLVVREGDPAPDTPAGVTFTSFLGGSGFIEEGSSGISFNDAGQLAMLIGLAGTGVTPANNSALYLFDPVAGAVKIAREGDLFDAGGGVFRTIADGGLTFNAGLNDDMVNGLNNQGTIVFGLRFTDNTGGIFTATVPVPEPTGLTTLAWGSLLLIFRRRHQSGR